MRLNKTVKKSYLRRRGLYGGSGKGKHKASRRNARAPAPAPPPAVVGMNNASTAFMMEMMSHFLATKTRFENAVAVDCEMVGVGSKSALGHVAIVDFDGKQLYNKYVIPTGGTAVISNYRERFSGLTEELLKKVELNNSKKATKEHSFEVVKREVHAILKDRIIVGHGLKSDFSALEFVPNPDNVWDSTEIAAYMKDHPFRPGEKQAKKLKVLAKEIAGNSIQQETKTGHSPLEDARASMNIYRLSLSYPKVVYENMSKP
jgi:hypothetical protein